MRELGIWVEVTTLVVPGMNDSEAELARHRPLHRRRQSRHALARQPLPSRLSSTPDTPATPVETLELARDLGKQAGLRYIYVGNVWGEGEKTACPQCGRELISRTGFTVTKNEVRHGACPHCGTQIAGVF